MPHRATRSITVPGTPEEHFRLWSDFESFPSFMKRVREVRRTGDRTSHWVMEGPMGREIEWDAEVTRMDPGRRIAWNSRQDENADLVTSGEVTFTELPKHQTQITATVQYEPRGAMATVGQAFMDPDKLLAEDLENFKRFASKRNPPAR